MAAQLIGQDQAVEFLGMIDTLHPSFAAADMERGESLPSLIFREEDGGEGDGTGPGDRASAAAGADPGAFANRGRENGLLLTVDEAREAQEHLRTSLHSLRGYSPRPVSLPVHLFFARDDAGVDRWRGWQALRDDVSIRATPVPGTHLSMMEAPNVEALGRALSREIGRATANRNDLPEAHDSPADAAEGEAW
jgi:arthrofactin-type cyclic lipopeptide synthetase C